MPTPYVIGPDGEPLTLGDLPPSDLKRWVARRKAEVVLAVEGGLLTMDQACRRYGLTFEEFLGWERALERHGINGLKASHAQFYRGADRPRRNQKPAQPRLSTKSTAS
jgi:hypothetical protein